MKKKIVKKKKISEKQKKDAVECVVSDLDELHNKPRRLFSSLEFLAMSFLKDDDHRKEVLDDIDEWEEWYYKKFDFYNLVDQIASDSADVKRKLLSRVGLSNLYDKDPKYLDGYKDGVKKAIEKLRLKIITETLNELY